MLIYLFCSGCCRVAVSCRGGVDVRTRDRHVWCGYGTKSRREEGVVVGRPYRVLNCPGNPGGRVGKLKNPPKAVTAAACLNLTRVLK
jgi:hypothetical protein